MHHLHLAHDESVPPVARPKSLEEVSELLAGLSAQLNGACRELERVSASSARVETAGAVNCHSVESDVRRAKALRALRRKLLGSDYYSGAPWEMLLHLYDSHLRQLKDSITSLTAGSGVALTTVMRWAPRLQQDGLVLVYVDGLDARRRYIHLSPAGAELMTQYFTGASTHLIAA
jgi:DNA-binding MarR family transcriptional regulator